MWTGLPLSRDEALKKFDVDEVRYSTDVNGSLAAIAKEPGNSTVWAIYPQISDHITFLEFKDKDLTLLKEAIEECRVVKDAYEIALIREANDISAGAHHAAMRTVKRAQNERELEAIFLQHCISNGSREQAYHSIVASGTNAATLHYQKNNEPLSGRLNLLLDAGCEYQCYASDITRTFPLNGTFSPRSRSIYNLVLLMQDTCIRSLKANVIWEEIHLLAHKVAISGLLELGILKGGSQDEILKARTSAAFFPHGLGHYLGLDTHDTGGHPSYEDEDRIFRYLRVRGGVPAGSVVTVEPGVSK
jgi:Xaa-Pro dipeptidase